MDNNQRLNKPTHQKLLWATGFVLAGFIAFGNILDALNNSFSLITPWVTCIGTVFVLGLWCIAEFRVRRHGISWLVRNKNLIRVTRLGLQVRLGIFGVIIALWIPTIVKLLDYPKGERSKIEHATSNDGPPHQQLTAMSPITPSQQPQPSPSPLANSKRSRSRESRLIQWRHDLAIKRLLQ
jgi:hypothetical protein